MKYKQIWKTAAACLMAAAMLPGCSDEEGGGTTNPEDKYRTLVVSFGPLDSAEPVGTRAGEEDLDDPDFEESDEYERHIDQYWLVMLKESEAGTGNFLVERVIKPGDEEYVTSTNPAQDSDTELTVEVEIGQTYRFYALANLDGLANAEEVKGKIEGLKQGDSFSPESLNAEMKPMSAYHSGEGGSYIPMTSYGYTQEILDNTERLEDPIALIRLLGKVELSIQNETENPITVNGLTMKSFRTTGDIFLFPYDVTGTTQYLLDPLQSEILTPTFPEIGTTNGVLDFVDNATTVEAHKTQSFPAQFINETGEIGHDFEIIATIGSTERKPENITASFLRRNDWLKIPILIAPVNGLIEINQQHMPIGGIPTSIGFKANEPVVPITWVTQRHAGEIEVTYTITIDNVDGEAIFTNPTLVYDGGTQRDSEATITTDADNLILDEVITLNPSTTNKLSGSFSVTTQELVKTTTATIDLSLVIAETLNEGESYTPDSKMLTIPYTIVITNGMTGGN